MRERVRFLLGHESREIADVDPTLTVLDWLRAEERRTGTKEGCNEGDCGACTVVLARPDGERLRYEAVNACIRFVPTLDGCQLLTVEDLKGPDGRLHPVQQALVDCHGSQCGFCTPGFAMAMFAFGRNAGGSAPDDQAIDDALAGNLCRCTGYAPIARAAEQAFEVGASADYLAGREAETLARLREIQDEETVAVGDGERRFYAPATADALAGLLLEHPEATVVAGATDVGLWVTKFMRRPDPVVYVGRVRNLRRVEETADGIGIGAAVTYTEAAAALARHYPDMGELLRRLGAVQVRNCGTIGGNVANGSPIGDSSPALIAVGATLHLRRGDERRSMPLEKFFIAYGEQDRRPGEFVERITVPKPAPGTRYRAYKVSKRFDQDITAVLGAFLLRVEGGRVAEVRLAYGGMAATPKRAAHAERALTGRPWTEATVRAAMAALERDFRPISDARASAGYRLRVARNLLVRLLVETSGGDGDEVETRLVGDRRLAHV